MNPDLEQPDPRAVEAAAWLARTRQTLSGKEERDLSAWLADERNVRAFDAVLTAWTTLGEGRGARAFGGFRSAANAAYEEARKSRLARRSNRRRAGLALAASLALALLGTLYLAMLPDVYRTGIGEHREARLEDGSRISLDADTVVEVAFHDSRRELRLIRGRAKFDVAKDTLRPFTVSAGNQMVVATGTSFSVEVLPSTMKVVLFEGRVEVLARSDGRLPRGDRDAARRHEHTLNAPGSEFEADLGIVGGKARVGKAAPASDWEAGELAFDDEELGDVMARFNRYSEVKLVAGDPVANRTRVSGVYRANDLAGFLEAVHEINGLQSKRTGDLITLTAPTK